MVYDALVRTAADADAAPEGAAKPAACALLARARALVDRQLHIVGKLAQVGFARARAMAAEWNVPPPQGLTAAQARDILTYRSVTSSRVNRAVRMAVFLRERLIGDLRKLAKGSLVDAQRVLNDIPLSGLSEQVTRNLRLDCIQAALTAALQRAPAAAEVRARPAPAPEPAVEEEEEPRGRRQVLQTLHFPLHRPEPRERRPVDPLKAYVRSRPVGDVIEEICIELDLALDTPEAMERAYEEDMTEARRRAAENAAEGRGRGRRESPAPPPSSASRTLPPEGKDLRRTPSG